MPARSASCGDPTVAWPAGPCTTSSAPVPRSTCRKASWPCPSRPANPTSSPARRVKSIGRPSGRSLTARTSSSSRPGACPATVSPASSEARSSPVISRRSSRLDASPRLRLATVSPARITTMRSAISSTSSIRWEMNTTPAPVLASLRTISKRCLRAATSSAELASSRRRTRGPRTSARTMQQAWRSLSDRSSTGRARSTVRPRSSPSPSSASRRRSPSSTWLRRRPSAPSQTLSSTDREPGTRTSWNTAAIPASSAARGEAREIRSSSISTMPASGWWTPARIFTSVLLPEPFSPISARTSPAPTSTEADRTAWVGPKDLAMPVARSRPKRGAAREAAPPLRSAERSSIREVRVHDAVRHQVGRLPLDGPGRVQRPARVGVLAGVAARERDRLDDERVDLQPLAIQHPQGGARGQVHPLVVAGDGPRPEVAARHVLDPVRERALLGPTVEHGGHRPAGLLERLDDRGRHDAGLDGQVDLLGVGGQELQHLRLHHGRREVAHHLAGPFHVRAGADHLVEHVEREPVDVRRGYPVDAQDVALAVQVFQLRGERLSAAPVVGADIDGIPGVQRVDPHDGRDPAVGGGLDRVGERGGRRGVGDDQVDALLHERVVVLDLLSDVGAARRGQRDHVAHQAALLERVLDPAVDGGLEGVDDRAEREADGVRRRVRGLPVRPLALIDGGLVAV